MSENILEEANRITSGDRHRDYGGALKEAERFAAMVNAATGLSMESRHYWVIMVCLKLVRERHLPKRDNKVDIAGYARVGEMFYDELDELIGDARVGEDSSAATPSVSQPWPVSPITREYVEAHGGSVDVAAVDGKMHFYRIVGDDFDVEPAPFEREGDSLTVWDELGNKHQYQVYRSDSMLGDNDA